MRSVRLRSHMGVLSLAVLGLIALVIYVTAIAIPFSVLKLGDTQLLSFAGITGQTKSGALRYALTLGIPFVLYLGGFVVLWRWRVWTPLIFLFPLLFGLGLLLVYPVTAQDVFLYGAQGWVLAHEGANPLVTPAGAFPDNPFLGWTAYTGLPSTYGPLWMYISAAVSFLGGAPIMTVVGFKVVGLAALLGGAVLAYLIGNRLRRGSGAVAAYVLGWNPLVLWSTVANGHNDMVMTVLILLSLYLLLRWPIYSLSALMLAALVKYSAVLLLPVFILYLWRRRYPLRRIGLALLLAGVTTAVVVAPLWAGSKTFLGLQDQLREMITMSPGATLAFWAEARGVAEKAAERFARDVLYVVFAVVYGAIVLRVSRRSDSVVAASFGVLMALLLLATLWFRSWYVVWPLALAAPLAATHKWLAASGIAFSGSALLVYLFTDYLWVWYGTELKLHLILMAVVFAPPLVALVAGAGLRLMWRRRQAETDFVGARA